MSSSQTSDGTYSDEETNSATITSAPNLGKATTSFTNVIRARYYKAKVRVCDQDGTSNCTSYSNLSDAFALPVKLAKPANLDVEPMLLRKAKIKWGSVSNVGSYTIKQTGSKTVDITDINATYKEIALDDYLADDIVDTFSVKAVSNDDLYEDSNYSDAIRIVDNPILRADGDNSSLASSATTGSAIVKWTRASGASKYSIRYRKMGGDHTQETWADIPRTVGTQREDWTDFPFGNASTATPSSVAQSHTLTRLELEEVYAIQLNYEQNGQKVFSGRDAYVWPSRGFPAEDERVATYPYFGHWPNKEFTYRICENTFPTSDKTKWVNLINDAFEQWETATDGFITITRDTSTPSCLSSVSPSSPNRRPLTPIERDLVRQYPHQSNTLHINDVYLVDDNELARVQATFRNFIGRPIQGQCLFIGKAPACAVTKAYGSDAEASTQLRNTLGSNNGVDIMFAKSSFYAKMDDGTVATTSGNVEKPSSVKFNHCIPGSSASNRNMYSAYINALHEAGHALGTSGYSNWDLLRFLGGKERGEREIYRRAHPSIPDAVMNYDERITGVSDEPDCSPHPFDILAIWALYQTVGR